jgi:hypothetical protein
MKKHLILLLIIFKLINANSTIPKIIGTEYKQNEIFVTFELNNEYKKINIDFSEDIDNHSGFSIFQGISINEICLESHSGNAYKEYTIKCYIYNTKIKEWIHTHDMIGSYYDEISDNGMPLIKDNFIYHKVEIHNGLYNPKENYKTDYFLALPIEVKEFLDTKIQLKEKVWINPINLVKSIKIFPITNENLSLYTNLANALKSANLNAESDYLFEQIKKFKSKRNIQSSKQPLYKTPSEKTKMYLVKGDEVEILEEKDDWLYILYKGKKDIKAWIPKSAVE